MSDPLDPSPDPLEIRRAARSLAEARGAAALTGAGISVESGIPDFRSPGGLWSRFDPVEYATLSCFLATPEKSWRLFRALGESMASARPNPAHRALAALEESGLILGVVTQNIDGLHQAAGSRNVLEIHGNGRQLHCVACERRRPMEPIWLAAGPVPRCPSCGGPLKPDIVLFDEPVREMDRIVRLLGRCDRLIVAGTSAQVAPAALLPDAVLARGGSLLEMNLEPTHLSRAGLGFSGAFVGGRLAETLPALAALAQEERRGTANR